MKTHCLLVAAATLAPAVSIAHEGLLRAGTATVRPNVGGDDVKINGLGNLVPLMRIIILN